MHIDEQFDGNSAGLMNRVPVDPYEIEREAVIAMLEREQRSLTASLIALALMAVGVAAMPNPLPMTVLLALRFCSFLYTRKAAARLEQLARARQRRVSPARTTESRSARTLTAATRQL